MFGFDREIRVNFQSEIKDTSCGNFLIFGVSGSASIFVSDIVLDVLNLEKFDVPKQIYWPLRLIVLFFCYQFILLAVSACFGELKHFSKYTKRIFFFLKN